MRDLVTMHIMQHVFQSTAEGLKKFIFTFTLNLHLQAFRAPFTTKIYGAYNITQKYTQKSRKPEN